MALQIPKLPPFLSKLLAFFNNPQKSEKNTVQRSVGLNIGRENIIITEVSFTVGKPTLEQCVRSPIIKNKSIAQQIKTLFQEMKFDIKRIRVSLKGQGVVVRYLSFPRMSRADFASSIQFEAEKYLPFSISDVALDYHILENGDSQSKAPDPETMRVILVAVRKTEIDRLLNIAQESGLKLQAIDLDVFALVNAFHNSNEEAKTKSLALVDLGAVDSTLAVLNKGNLVFSRDIAFGGNDFTEIIRRKLNISLEEALRIQYESQSSDLTRISVIEEGLDRLLQELSSSLTYYYDQQQNASPIEAVYISGGFSQLNALPNLLEKRIQASIKKWDPVAGLTLGAAVKQENLKELTSYLPVSIGLAIRTK